MRNLNFLSILFFLITLGCSRTPVKVVEDAMRPTEKPEEIQLDPSDSFFQARDLTVERLSKMGDREIHFGSCSLKAEQYAGFLEKIPQNREEFNSYLKSEAQWFEVYGRDEWSEILLTSYFSPLYEARRKPEGVYTQPVYKVPDDLVEVSLRSFGDEQLADLKTDRNVVSARIKEGPGSLKRVVPYYSRKEIDVQNSLKGKNLEIAYLDPIDAFFLQIQGSGKIRFKDGKIMSLGYGAQNGYRYNSIGRLLYEYIPKEEMSMAKIEEYLYSLSREQLYDFLSLNPSYVFFKDLESKPAVTTLGIRVFDQVTLAVDPSLMPLGAMGVLHHPVPEFDNHQSTTPTSFSQGTKIIFAHDTGGAIKGADRADLYWGEGKIAQQSAGVIKHPANLWFLAPRNVCLNDSGK